MQVKFAELGNLLDKLTNMEQDLFRYLHTFCWPITASIALTRTSAGH